MAMGPPPGNDWIAVTTEQLPASDIVAWAGTPGCGATVSFCGTVRDNSGGRGVVNLEYEAYGEYVEQHMTRIVREVRRRWPSVDRIALVHRVGLLAVGEIAVVVVTSAPHRAEAFAANAFSIDTLKTTAPIWKLERRDDGSNSTPDGCQLGNALDEPWPGAETASPLP
jgi:molybdopterin synthase catalytic subunit